MKARIASGREHCRLSREI